MEPSSGLLFSECPIFSAFTITVFYTVAFLLLLYFFAVPSYLPIHFTTAEFSASTGGSSSMALSPPRIRQLMPKTVIALESLQVVALASLHVVAPALIKHHLGTCSISCGTELILTACSSFLIKSLHQLLLLNLS
jgi:hypothetical protein